MGQLVISEFLTLDGVMEEPAWTAPYFGPEIGAFKNAELRAADALLQGRVTYEGMAAAWPGRSDEAGFAQRMNDLPKTVVSTTLTRAEWHNSEMVRGDVEAGVRALKARHAGDVLVFGSGALCQALLRAGLVDRLDLLVFPLVLGRGQRFFRERPETLELELQGTRTFPLGVLLLQYRPRSDAGTQEGAR